MSQRSGLSFVEFVGCLIALVGGVVLGAVYLGLDLTQMTYDVVESSGIVDPSVLGLTPTEEASLEEGTTEEQAAEQCIKGDAVDAAVVAEDAEDVEESPENQQPNLSPQDSPQAVVVDAPLSEEDRQVATGSYWEAFVTCTNLEAKTRKPGIGDANWQLLDYLTHRQKGHQKVLDTMQEVDRRGVDPRLLTHVDEVLEWHRSGNELFGGAINLLTNGPRSKLTGPFAQSWQSAATQHRMEERLVHNKNKVILGYLNHTYETLAPFQPAFDQ